MPGGFCWYLAETCWEDLARRANRQIVCEPPTQEGVEILKKGHRRFVFRLKFAGTDPTAKPVVIKSFPMISPKEKFLRYSRYGPAEVRNLLEAARRNLPVPLVFGYGQRRRWCLVLDTFIMMEDLAPRRLLGEMLTQAQGQPQEQAEILDRTLKMFVQLYHAGCNHIDTTRHSIWIGNNPADSTRVSDFQYARFLNKPSIKVLLCQAALTTRSCSDMVPAEILESWIEKLMTAAEIKNTVYWLKVYRRFLNSKMSRAQRLALR